MYKYSNLFTVTEPLETESEVAESTTFALWATDSLCVRCISRLAALRCITIMMYEHILDQLYEGEIIPADNVNPQSKEYKLLCDKIDKEHDYFSSLLPDSEKTLR